MTRTAYATQPLPRPVQPRRPHRTVHRWLVPLAAFAGALGLLYALLPGPQSGLPHAGKITLVVFAAAVLAWLSGKVDDTFVGLAAAVALVLAGVLSSGDLFAALGGETIWLLIAAFALAAGLTATGLPTRAAILLCARARSPRRLVHLVTAALVGTALAVPATSGRAALALPVFLALATALADRPKLVKALALTFPTVILLSAVASLIGAGAHVITSTVLATLTGSGISYGWWLLLGLPFAVVSSHLAAELVLLLFTDRATRVRPLRLDADQLAAATGVGVRGPLTGAQWRALAVLAGVVLLWCTESVHNLSPALVALLGAVLVTAPKVGTVTVSDAVDAVPWSLLLFMTTTTVLGAALSTSGAAAWLGDAVFGGAAGSPLAVLALVVGVSTAAHLVLQSRSARSSVIVPLVVPLAMAAGMNPVALAFASTVAAGFCHTMPSSAKPVAMFAGTSAFGKADLLRVSAVLAPLFVLLVLGFALAVWPAFGLALR
ncbi:SLC13 family permease [Amycolatopsis suaedae]|uniref:SLC13 family permease n=1 Tax=Amycolatopsis suaedae TaxID=2510978 RepID=A0A4Q7J151_9PSEU|nr:SLC13 family permease [Amycolatopsis suaedae]RZQ60549.1 SLC13 family permease [Amycolatopsis suaedae]